MRKALMLFIVLCLAFQAISQHKPIDTSYYESGAIKCIKYKGDIIFTGYQTNVYYEDNMEPETIGKPITDTSFYAKEIIFKTNQYLKNSIQLKRFYTDKLEPENGELGYSFEYYIFWIPLDELYSVQFNLAKDSTIRAFWISIKDSTNRFRSKEVLTKLEMKHGFDNKEYQRHIFSIPNGEITFHMQENSGYLLRDFYVGQYKDSIWVNKKIEFHQGSLKVKLSGEYTEGDKSGIWTEYYENGNIKSTGSYSILIDDKKDELKHGTWLYYSTKQKKIKQENWLNGKLQETKIF